MGLGVERGRWNIPGHTNIRGRLRRLRLDLAVRPCHLSGVDEANATRILLSSTSDREPLSCAGLSGLG